MTAPNSISPDPNGELSVEVPIATEVLAELTRMTADENVSEDVVVEEALLRAIARRFGGFEPPSTDWATDATARVSLKPRHEELVDALAILESADRNTVLTIALTEVALDDRPIAERTSRWIKRRLLEKAREVKGPSVVVTVPPNVAEPTGREVAVPSGNAIAERLTDRPFTSACMALREAQAIATLAKISSNEVKNRRTEVDAARKQVESAEAARKGDSPTLFGLAVADRRLAEAAQTLSATESRLSEENLRAMELDPGVLLNAEDRLNSLLKHEARRLQAKGDSDELSIRSMAALSLREQEWSSLEPWMRSPEGLAMKAAVMSVTNDIVRSELNTKGAELA